MPRPHASVPINVVIADFALGTSDDRIRTDSFRRADFRRCAP